MGEAGRLRTGRGEAQHHRQTALVQAANMLPSWNYIDFA